MEQRTIRLEVESLDIEDAAVTRLHQHRDPALPGFFAHQHLHVEGVALLDDQVETVEKAAEVLGRDALGNGHDPQIRVDLADTPRRHHGLVDAEVEDAARNAVQVRELECVEVGHAQFTGQALHGQDVGDGVPGAETHDTDAETALLRLLRPGDLVAVPIEPQDVEGTRAEEPHDGPPPWVIDPSLRLVLQRGRGRRLHLGQLLALLGQPVDHLQRRILAQHAQDLALVTRPHVEDQRAPRARAGRVGGDRAGTMVIGIARQLLALEAQGLTTLGRRQLQGPRAVPGERDGAVALVGKRDGRFTQHPATARRTGEEQRVRDRRNGVLSAEPVHGVGGAARDGFDEPVPRRGLALGPGAFDLHDTEWHLVVDRPRQHLDLG